MIPAQEPDRHVGQAYADQIREIGGGEQPHRIAHEQEQDRHSRGQRGSDPRRVGARAVLQDSRQENTQAARKLAQNKATETAFAKAFAKLGLQGFEMVSSPGLQFDQYVPNSAGTFTIQEGSSERTADIYFRRQR